MLNKAFPFVLLIAVAGLLFMQWERERFVYDRVDFGKGKEAVLLVDLSCPFCKKEIERLKEKYDLKLAVLERKEGDKADLYFKCSKDKRKAIEDILKGKIGDIKGCDVEEKEGELLHNLQAAVERGYRHIPVRLR